MQSGAVGVNWTAILGAVVGCLLVFGVSLGVLWFKKWKREQREERPPSSRL